MLVEWLTMVHFGLHAVVPLLMRTSSTLLLLVSPRRTARAVAGTLSPSAA